MRYSFKTIFAKTCKSRENNMAYPYVPHHPASITINIFLTLVLSKEFLHHIFFSEARICLCFHAEVCIELVWTEEHVSGARSPADGFLIWQLPWWSASAVQLGELVLKMQPTICFFSSPNISVSH